MSNSAKNSDTFFTWATAWGPVGAVAHGDSIIRFVLPHYQREDLKQLLAWEHSGAVADEKPFVRLIELTRDYFNGKAADFAGISVALPKEGTLSGKVLNACRGIPYGKTRSYLSLAEEIGSPDSARAVATALGKNQIPLIIPCHRVIYADGRLGGFSAAGGIGIKKRMIDLEKQTSAKPAQ